jgi:hypothetical protein
MLTPSPPGCAAATPLQASSLLIVLQLRQAESLPWSSEQQQVAARRLRVVLSDPNMRLSDVVSEITALAGAPTEVGGGGLCFFCGAATVSGGGSSSHTHTRLACTPSPTVSHWGMVATHALLAPLTPLSNPGPPPP